MAARYLAGETLASIGADFGLTRERVRQILKPLQIKRPTQKQLGKPFDPTDPRWRHGEGRNNCRASWMGRSIALMHSKRERREELVAWLALFAARLGRTPKLDELRPEFGYHWQVLAITFSGRMRSSKSKGQSIGLRRWFRLAGLTVRPTGTPGQISRTTASGPCRRCGMNDWRPNGPSSRRCGECSRRHSYAAYHKRKANAMTASVGVLGIRRVG